MSEKISNMTKFTARHTHVHTHKIRSPAAKTTANASLIRSLIAKNYLLKLLPAPEARRLQSKLELVTLESGQILSESNQSIEYAYFPLTAIAVSLYELENGTSASVNLIGNDGLIGIAALLGAGSVPHEVVVQCPGKALRIRSLDLLREFRRDGVLQTLVLRFTMALFEQTARTAVCNRLHPIEMQLCRWLLLTHDRLETNNFFMTHELISKILGSSRESITITLKKLKEKKMLDYRRGEIIVLDRLKIEAYVCECYHRVVTEYNRLLVRGVSRTFG